MLRRTHQRSIALVCVLACCAIGALMLASRGAGAGESTPHATQSVALPAGSWDFERCAQGGWLTRSRGSGAWHVYASATTPPDPQDSDPHYPFRAPRPPQGHFAAVTDMSAAGSRILYRDATLRGHLELRFTLFYDNHAAARFDAPLSLDHELSAPNQQYRVDLMDPSAPIDSTARGDVLATIFQTKAGDPDRLGPRAMSFDLAAWAGRKVRIRFAQVDNRGPLRAGVDDVRLAPAGR